MADFNYTGSPIVNFTNTSTNGTSYLWDFGDGNTSTNQNPNHTYTSNGNYTVTLTTYGNDTCYSDISTKSVNIGATEIETINPGKNLLLYPNPTKGIIEIKTKFKYNSISIVDITGKEIKQFNAASKIDVNSLNKGVYFVKLIGTDNTIVQKFVKE